MKRFTTPLMFVVGLVAVPLLAPPVRADMPAGFHQPAERAAILEVQRVSGMKK